MLFSKTTTRILFTFIILSALSCSQSNFRNLAADPADSDSDSSQNAKGEIPECQLDPVNYRINARLLSFYLTGGGGINASLDLVNSPVSSVGLDVDWTTFKMNTHMEFYNAYETDAPAEWDEDGIKKSNINFSIGAMIGGLGLGVKNNSVIVLEEMVQKAFHKNLKKIDQNLSKRPSIWETAVKEVNSSGSLTIPVGESQDLMIGDRLSIYKGDFEWEGEPCYSTRKFKNDEPELIAEAEVIPASQGYKNRAFLKIISKSPDATVKAGDIVRFKAFANNKKRSPYKYSVRVENVDQMAISIAGASGNLTQVDMTPVLKGLLRKVIHNKFDNYEVKDSALSY